MQYPETLPLRDHEVVLTFDDGPLPHNSNQILDILAAQCVKATFFEIGRMAQAYPEGVRKLPRRRPHRRHPHPEPSAEHESHADRARQAGDRRRHRVGESSARRRHGACAVLPHSRPAARRRRSRTIWPRRASRSGAPIFRPTTGGTFPPSRVYELAIKRLEAKGKGILLLHDIQARTVAALPRILQELKARGYRIVHVVPATPRTAGDADRAAAMAVASAVGNRGDLALAENSQFRLRRRPTCFPAPALSDLDWRDGRVDDACRAVRRAGRHPRGIPLPRQAPWPRQSPLAGGRAANALPVPALSIFEIKEGLRAATAQSLLPLSHHAEQTVATVSQRDGIARLIAVNAGGNRGKHHLGGARKPGASKIAGRATRNAAVAGRGTLRHLVQVKKRNV